MMTGRRWVAAPRPLRLTGMFGLGDNLMQRPFIRAASLRQDVYLHTSWPELYADMPRVLPVRSRTHLRTQAINEARWRGRWHTPAAGYRQARLRYGPSDLQAGNIYEAFERQLPLGDCPLVMDLPPLKAPQINTRGKPLAVVKPVTARSEWLNTARNPLPEYVCAISDALAATHHVVVIGHLQEGQEWLEGDLPVADDVFMHGELSSMEALALVASADVVVGGVGWIVPAAIAAKRRAFIVLGGQGAHNAPEKITDPRLDLSRIHFALPDAYCRCDQKTHNCERQITDLMPRFVAWASSQGVPL